MSSELIFELIPKGSAGRPVVALGIGVKKWSKSGLFLEVKYCFACISYSVHPSGLTSSSSGGRKRRSNIIAGRRRYVHGTRRPQVDLTGGTKLGYNRANSCISGIPGYTRKKSTQYRWYSLNRTICDNFIRTEVKNIKVFELSSPHLYAGCTG